MRVGPVSVLAAILAVLASVSVAADATPRRIASLNLGADEMLLDLVGPERLVAVTSFVDDPLFSNTVGRVPPAVLRVTRAQIERLVEVRPDLVVVSEFTDADFLAMLTASGLRHFRLQGLDSLEGIAASLLALGQAVGEPERAQSLVAAYTASLAQLDRRLAGAARPRVLFWRDPDAFGSGTLFDAIIARAGGRNAAAERGVRGVRPVGVERTLAMDPDVILVGAGGERARLLAHPVLSRLRAVREGRVFEVPGPLLSTLSHHAARTCWAVAHALHPDRVPETSLPR